MFGIYFGYNSFSGDLGGGSSSSYLEPPHVDALLVDGSVNVVAAVIEESGSVGGRGSIGSHRDNYDNDGAPEFDFLNVEEGGGGAGDGAGDDENALATAARDDEPLLPQTLEPLPERAFEQMAQERHYFGTGYTSARPSARQVILRELAISEEARYQRYFPKGFKCSECFEGSMVSAKGLHLNHLNLLLLL